MTGIPAPELRGLYAAARATLATFPGPEADRFVTMLPDDPGTPRNLATVRKPGADQLAHAIPDPRFDDLFALISRSADRLEWRQSYSTAEVGASYLKGMGFVELMGLRGHYPSETVAFGFVVIGPDSLYPEHRHRSEEIYAPIAGQGEWRYDFGDWERHGAGETVFTASNRWHALRTREEVLVMLYAWLGGDLAQKSEIAPHGGTSP